MKTEFISIASHELRTPLSAIKGFISMINKGDYGKVDKKLERPLQLVAASTERLINIVNEMLDVTRIEANRIQLLVRDVDVRELLDVAVSNLQPLISQSKIKLSVVVDKSIPKAHADQEKAIEILNNLISNALKFTEKGRIEISAKKDKTKLVIAIKDTGTGISRQDQAKLFNKFEQLKSKKAGNVSGTGLGLYISKEFARKMGGDVWLVESKVMHGSTFALSLPLANQEENKKNK
jgi:signal transduction histidine kinase